MPEQEAPVQARARAAPAPCRRRDTGREPARLGRRVADRSHGAVGQAGPPGTLGWPCRSSRRGAPRSQPGQKGRRWRRGDAALARRPGAGRHRCGSVSAVGLVGPARQADDRRPGARAGRTGATDGGDRRDRGPANRLAGAAHRPDGLGALVVRGMEPQGHPAACYQRGPASQARLQRQHGRCRTVR